MTAAERCEGHGTPHAAAPGEQAKTQSDARDLRDEEITRLRSRALLAGWALHIIAGSDGGARFLLLKWSRSIELTDPAAVHEFLDRAGAAQ